MSEVKKGDSVVVQIEGRLRNKAIFVPVYVESEEYNGSFDAWAPSGHLRRYHTSQVVYFAKSMIDAEAWAEEHKGLTVQEFRDSVNSSEDSKRTIESSTKQWYTVYIHNNEGAASRGYDMDTRDVIRVKCENDDEAFVKACDLIEEHWEDPDDAFDCLKNQDVTSGDPFVYAIEDPNEELIFDLGFRDIEEYFEEIESCIAVEASTKYYGLFEYLPGSPEDGMSADSFDLLEVVEAPSEEAAVKMLNPPADDDSQFVRELTKEDYEMYGVDLTYPLDPSKISSSETSHKSNVTATTKSVEHTYEVTVGDVESYSVNAVSKEAAIQFVIDNYFTREDKEEYEDDPNYIWAELIEDKTTSSTHWPKKLTYHEYDEGDQLIQGLIDACDKLDVFEAPSSQGGFGEDFFLDNDTNEELFRIDLKEEEKALLSLYYKSTSYDDYVQKVCKWLESNFDRDVESSKKITSSKELELSTSRQYGDYKCLLCGEPLDGYVIVVNEVDDDEGLRWRSFHKDCFKKLGNLTLEEIYNKYPTNEIVSYTK